MDVFKVAHLISKKARIFSQYLSEKVIFGKICQGICVKNKPTSNICLIPWIFPSLLSINYFYMNVMQ